MSEPRYISEKKLQRLVLFPHQLEQVPFYQSPCILKHGMPSREVNEYEVAEANIQHKRIVIIGHCGNGKTALLEQFSKRALQNEILQNSLLVIHLNLKKPEVLELTSPTDLVQFLGIQESSSSRLLFGDGESVVFWFDGWSESFKNHPKYRSSFICKVLRKDILRECSLTVACRPSDSHFLHEMSTIDALFEVKGLRMSGIHEYLKMEAKVLGITRTETLFSFLSQHEALYHLCSNPLAANLILGLYKTNQLLSQTASQVLNFILIQVLKRESRPEGERSLPEDFSLLPGVLKKLRTIGKFALTDLVTEELDQRELSYFCLREASPGIEHTRGLALLESVADVYQSSDRSLRLSYSFLHHSLQEHLASLYLVHQPMMSQLCFFYNKSLTLVDKYANVTKHFFGLTHCDSQLSSSSTFSPAKLGLASILDCLVHELRLEEQPVVKRFLFVLHCLYEAREGSLVRRFVKRHGGLLTICLSGYGLSEYDYSSLAFLVSNSGIPKWQAEVSNHTERQNAEYLAFLITSNTTSSTIDVNIADGGSFIFRPAEGIRKEGKRVEKKFLHGLFCQSAKDILHQVLQLFSPVRVHSNSSDPSYMSFVACSCLQQAVESSIEFEPTPAIHWVPLPPKSRSQQKKQSSEAEAAQRHLEMHGMARMELIILTTPYLRSIKFLLPGTNEQIIIALSNDNDPTTDVTSTKYVEEDSGQKVTAVQESGHIGNSDMIIPPMPLPRKDATS